MRRRNPPPGRRTPPHPKPTAQRVQVERWLAGLGIGGRDAQRLLGRRRRLPAGRLPKRPRDPQGYRRARQREAERGQWLAGLFSAGRYDAATIPLKLPANPTGKADGIMNTYSSETLTQYLQRPWVLIDANVHPERVLFGFAERLGDYLILQRSHGLASQRRWRGRVQCRQAFVQMLRGDFGTDSNITLLDAAARVVEEAAWCVEREALEAVYRAGAGGEPPADEYALRDWVERYDHDLGVKHRLLDWLAEHDRAFTEQPGLLAAVHRSLDAAG